MAFVAGLVRGLAAGFAVPTVAALATTAIGVALAGYSLAGLVPMMRAAGEARFERYHAETCSLRWARLVYFESPYPSLLLGSARRNRRA